jgi:hypothetical protein
MEINITGGTEQMIKFEVIVGGKNTGELQVERAEATRMWGFLFQGNYKIVSADDRKIINNLENTLENTGLENQKNYFKRT